MNDDDVIDDPDVLLFSPSLDLELLVSEMLVAEKACLLF